MPPVSRRRRRHLNGFSAEGCRGAKPLMHLRHRILPKRLMHLRHLDFRTALFRPIAPTPLTPHTPLTLKEQSMIEQLETRLLMSVSVDPSDPSSDPALTTDTQI